MSKLKILASTLLNYFALTVMACLFSGIFGALHDQVSYSLSPEYFTLFKFQQFQLLGMEGPERWKAGIVGFLASWWIGVAIGLVAFIPCFITHRGGRSFRCTLRGFLIVAGITAVFSLFGILAGFHNTQNNPDMFNDWYVPEGTQNVRHFLIVGSMHNFTYLGGAFGMIAVLTWQIFQLIRTRFVASSLGSKSATKTA